MKAIDRACLQYAAQVVYGIDQFYVTPDGGMVLHDKIEAVDPSGSVLDAVIATLASMMKLHLLGCTMGQLLNDLLRMGVGEDFANRVHDHLDDVSDAEWDGLRRRVRWYADEHKAFLDATQPLNEVHDGWQ